MPDYTSAIKHLSKDPVLKGIIRKVGPCTLAPQDDHFSALVESIVHQQLSMKAAATIHSRLMKLVKGKMTPKRILALTPEQRRSAGISSQKSSYLIDLSKKFNNLDIADAHSLDDEEVIRRLVLVKGIGRWTAEMFLIFTLNRLDVLPVDDLGLKIGVKTFYSLKDLPTKERLVKIAEPWKPFRSIGTWYVWQGLK